jgi:hypothetical protein
MKKEIFLVMVDRSGKLVVTLACSNTPAPLTIKT